MNVYALIGSLTLIFFLIKREKDRHDKNKKLKATWKEFFGSNWDDFVLAIISGQALSFIQQPVFKGYATWSEWDNDKTERLYEDSEIAISFVVGFCATFLIGWLYKYAVKKTSGE